MGNKHATSTSQQNKIKEDKNNNNVYKIILLGPGESGKSTFYKVKYLCLFDTYRIYYQFITGNLNLKNQENHT